MIVRVYGMAGGSLSVRLKFTAVVDEWSRRGKKPVRKCEW